MKLDELLNEGPMDYVKGFGQELGNKVRNIAQPFKDMHNAGQSSSYEAEITKIVVKLANTLQQYYKLKKQLGEGVMDYVKGAGKEIGNKVKNLAQPFKDIHAAGQLQHNKSKLSELVQLSKQQLTQLSRLINKYGMDKSLVVIDKAFKKYQLPFGLKGIILNKLKGMINQPTNNTPRQRPTEQPLASDTSQQKQSGPEKQQWSGAGVRAVDHKVKPRFIKDMIA
jgi:hypothetical protein